MNINHPFRQVACGPTSSTAANGIKSSKLAQGSHVPFHLAYAFADTVRFLHPRRELEKVIDGRRSFPSGHSSTAFAGMTFLALYLAGLTGAWCLTQPVPGGSLLRSKLARLTLTLLPLGFATWVAVSRMEDYVRSNLTPRDPTRSRGTEGVLTHSAAAATPQRRRDRWESARRRLRDNVLPHLLAEPVHIRAGAHRADRLRQLRRFRPPPNAQPGEVWIRVDWNGSRARTTDRITKQRLESSIVFGSGYTDDCREQRNTLYMQVLDGYY